jgi:5'-3' exoribonuclease 1
MVCVLSHCSPQLMCQTAMASATDMFSQDGDKKVKEVRAWLKSKGVSDFEPVSLLSDQLPKVA